VQIPITVSTPATIFSKIYVDVMNMPTSGGFKFIVAARDNLSLTADSISHYNKQVNRVVERGHFTIRESLMNLCKDRPKSWAPQVPLTFFTDRVSTSKVTGCSPFYMLHEVRPVLPFDLTKATFM
ncbi:hypothetical protein PILCRDRAFT_34294, partial [Piloderma croceum F 1598]